MEGLTQAVQCLIKDSDLVPFCLLSDLADYEAPDLFLPAHLSYHGKLFVICKFRTMNDDGTKRGIGYPTSNA